MQNKNQKEKRESFYMKFFLFVIEKERNKYARDKCNDSEKNTRELHLELGGDIVTYVRVY